MPFPEGVPVYAGLAGINLSPARLFDTNFVPLQRRRHGRQRTRHAHLHRSDPRRRRADRLARHRGRDDDGADRRSADLNRGPGWAFGYGGSILTDPAAALSPQSPGTFGWGGVWGHSWFIDPVKKLSVVSLSNTALEGMMGRYIRDLRDAIYADLG